MGWANRRTPFGRPRYAHVSDYVRAQLRKGVGWSALHSFGCTATSCYAVTTGYKKRAQTNKRPHAKFK